MSTPPGYGPPPGDEPRYGQPHGQPQYAQPPFSQQGYGYGYGRPAAPMASWIARVGASLIDSLISLAPMLVGYGVLIANIVAREENPYPDDDPEAFAIIVFLVGVLASIGLTLWNRVFRQGRTGQSVGKSALHIRLIDAGNWQPIGAWRAFLRDFLSGVFNNACFLNVLWPLWDEQQQTWHDKVMNTYVVKT